MSEKDVYRELSEANPEALVPEGFSEAFLGYTVGGQGNSLAVFSYDRCVDVLVEKGLTPDEAVEYLDHNTIYAYFGENSPIYMKTNLDQ